MLCKLKSFLIAVFIMCFSTASIADEQCNIKDHLGGTPFSKAANTFVEGATDWDITKDIDGRSLLYINGYKALNMNYVDVQEMNKFIKKKTHSYVPKLDRTGHDVSAYTYLDHQKKLYGLEVVSHKADKLYGILDLRISDNCGVTFAWDTQTKKEFMTIRNSVWDTYFIMAGYFELSDLKPDNNIASVGVLWLFVLSVALFSIVFYAASTLGGKLIRDYVQGHDISFTIKDRYTILCVNVVLYLLVTTILIHSFIVRLEFDDFPLLVLTLMMAVSQFGLVFTEGHEWFARQIALIVAHLTLCVGLVATSFYWHPFALFLYVLAAFISLVVSYGKLRHAIVRSRK